MDAEYYRLDSQTCFKDLQSIPIDKSETIKLYGQILKINKRNKKQKRIFMLTDKAIYNIIPKNKNIKRRIDLLSISSITTSVKSTEFTLNIPSEYDYHYNAISESFHRKIIFEMSKQIINLQHEIFINQINDTSTNKWTITKNVLKTINSHYNETVRIVMALDYLTDMGFKSKMALKALKKNGINLRLAMHSLLEESEQINAENLTVKSPFSKKVNIPIITKINFSSDVGIPIANQLSPTVSSTEEVNDYFAVQITK